VQVHMWNAEGLSREQIREFLQSSEAIEFAGCGRNEKYAWAERVLRAHRFATGGIAEAQFGDQVRILEASLLQILRGYNASSNSPAKTRCGFIRSPHSHSQLFYRRRPICQASCALSLPLATSWRCIAASLRTTAQAARYRARTR